MEQIIRIAEFILKSFLHIWPYLLVTIPLAVLVNLSGASKYITAALSKSPMLSVFLATIVGAFSPFCSCGVIPVISSLLIGGVPIAPVMSFWIASPSMDPEIFFLSSSVLGWKLAVWRLGSTFIISLFAGYMTHFVSVKGFISDDILKSGNQRNDSEGFRSFMNSVRFAIKGRQADMKLVTTDCTVRNNICCTVSASSAENKCNCSSQAEDGTTNNTRSSGGDSTPQWKRISSETLKATLMVTKFMGFAFLITALIKFYLPEDMIGWVVKANPTVQVVLATLTGIPMYTSNTTALPLVGGLIEAGLNKGAALSFLIAGATTTLPAMVAVWGITKRRVFTLYLMYALFGALLTGLCFNLMS